MDVLCFVPDQPLLSLALVGCTALGAKGAVRTLASDGAPVQHNAAWLGCGLAAGMSVLALMQGNSLFAWHVVGMSLCAFFFQPTAVAAILARKAARTVEARRARVHDHIFLQLGAVGCATAAFLAVYYNRPGRHFTSLHAWFGLAGLVLMWANTLHGMWQRGNPAVPRTFWSSALHRSLGRAAFVTSMLAAFVGLGFKSHIVDWSAKPVVWNFPDVSNGMNGWAVLNGGPLLAQGTVMALFLIVVFTLAPLSSVPEVLKVTVMPHDFPELPPPSPPQVPAWRAISGRLQRHITGDLSRPFLMPGDDGARSPVTAGGASSSQV